MHVFVPSGLFSWKMVIKSLLWVLMQGSCWSENGTLLDKRICLWLESTEGLFNLRHWIVALFDLLYYLQVKIHPGSGKWFMGIRVINKWNKRKKKNPKSNVHVFPPSCTIYPSLAVMSWDQNIKKKLPKAQKTKLHQKHKTVKKWTKNTKTKFNSCCHNFLYPCMHRI